MLKVSGLTFRDYVLIG